MANEYASLAEAKARLINKVAAGDQTTELEGIREAASRAIDDYLEVGSGYFAPHGGVSSVKIIKGDGSSSIVLPSPLSGSVTITAADASYVPDFTVDGSRLVALNEDGYPSPYYFWYPIYYNVTGVWGYAATPAQIREACLQLIAHFWRGRDAALTGTITDMRQDAGQFPERDFPRMTRRILDDFKFTLGDKQAGRGGLVIA